MIMPFTICKRFHYHHHRQHHHHHHDTYKFISYIYIIYSPRRSQIELSLPRLDCMIRRGHIKLTASVMSLTRVCHNPIPRSYSTPKFGPIWYQMCDFISIEIRDISARTGDGIRQLGPVQTGWWSHTFSNMSYFHLFSIYASGMMI